jgi:hypothetical protein
MTTAEQVQKMIDDMIGVQEFHGGPDTKVLDPVIELLRPIADGNAVIVPLKDGEFAIVVPDGWNFCVGKF